MELEELKNTWKLLDSKLEEDKSLKESIILEMIHTKADKLVNKMINWDIVGVVILILLVPSILYTYSLFKEKSLMWDSYMIYSAALSLMFSFVGMYNLRALMKIDLAKKVSENIYYINKYNILTKRTKNALIFVLGPIYVIGAIMMYIELKANIYLWIFMGCMLLLAIFTSYGFYKKYSKNITSILRSLNEIKELEEKE